LTGVAGPVPQGIRKESTELRLATGDGMSK
jgi:hypothetical protein